MVNAFQAADAKSSAAISRVMGERVQLVPWKAGGDFTAGGPDPDRPDIPAYTFVATLSGALGSMNSSGDRADNFRGTVLTRDRQATVDRAAMPPGVVAGDRLKALDQSDQPLYEITAEPIWDGMNRWIVPLVIVPGATP